MSVGERQAQAAAGPGTDAAGRGGAGFAGARLRVAALAGAGLAILAAVVVVAAELAAARVPQQRAALEQLIRQETGLEVSFRELSVRWGWYGPEAVFHQVTLGEPQSGGALLRAPQLVVGLDTWRLVRSGRLAAGRIVLVSPEIEVRTGGAPPPATPPAARQPRSELLRTAARVLSRWRGDRIDVLGGALHLAPGSGELFTFNIRHAQLRRLGASWSAEAFVLLPASLGASAHVALTLSGDPAQGNGTLSFDGRRLNFALWRVLASQLLPQRYLPHAGQGTFALRARFAQGTVLEADGRVDAEALEWSAPRPGAAVLGLGRLAAHWQLRRLAGQWHLHCDELELGDGAGRATLELVAGADGSFVRGRARQLPLAALAALGDAPLGFAQLQGVARELTFDWNAARPAAARLQTSATLENVALASPQVQLGGLTAQVSGVGDELVAEVHSPAARLALARPEPLTLAGIAVAARLALRRSAGHWRLSTDDLELRRADFSVAASGELVSEGGAAAPRLDAHVSLKDADAVLVAQLLGPQSLAALGLPAAPVMAGRIESADFVVRTALDGGVPWEAQREFTGSMTLRAAHIAGGELWPDTAPLDARIEWHGPRLHAILEHAVSGSFELKEGSLDWDARGVRATRISGRLAGRAEEALGWLRAHPRLAAWTPGVRDLDVRGPLLLALDLTIPAARTASRAPAAHVTAVLDGAQLRPLPGVPPIEALRGTLAFAGGHLQRSTLTGQWLGGPASLAVAEHREHAASAVTISGRGLIAVRQALAAAGAGAAPLAGAAEWSALMTVSAGAWHLRADTSLVGLASDLPEPFAKSQAAALPLRMELQGSADQGELRVALSDRLHAVAALEHASSGWRIERGAVRLAATPPELPAEPVLAFDGRLSRLDLAAGLALWREAAADEALPRLAARLSAAELVAGTREYAEVGVSAEAARGAGQVQLSSAQLSGSLRWPALIDAAHPARVQFDRFDLARPEDAALAAALASLLAPTAHLTVGDLSFQGRSLGRLETLLRHSGAELEVSGLQLSGASGETRASVRCAQGACSAQLRLETGDAAATLAALGLRPEIRARQGLLTGELQWSPLAPLPLASLGGHLHMQLEEGEARPAVAQAGETPCALLSVPALMAALESGAHTGESALRFSRLTATYALRQGEASTSDLHFDGDAEILVRGRVGLVARDYDQQAFILRGEERLPAAVRRLGPTPKVAALWLSLRELFTGAERAPATLRLHGTWSDPIVGPAE